MIYAINKRTGERVVYRQDGSQPEIVGSADWEFVEADAQRAENDAVEEMFTLLREKTGREYLPGGSVEECCRTLHRAGYRKGAR